MTFGPTVNLTSPDSGTSVLYGAADSASMGEQFAPAPNTLAANERPGFWVYQNSAGGITHGVQGQSSYSPSTPLSSLATVSITGTVSELTSGDFLGNDGLEELSIGRSPGNGLISILRGLTPGSYASTYSIPLSPSEGITIDGLGNEGLAKTVFGDMVGSSATDAAFLATRTNSLNGMVYVVDGDTPLSSNYTTATLPTTHRISGFNTAEGLRAVGFAPNFDGKKYLLVGSSGINFDDGSFVAIDTSTIPATFDIPSMNATHGFRMNGEPSGLAPGLGSIVTSADISGGSNSAIFVVGAGQTHVLLRKPDTFLVNDTFFDGTNGFRILNEGFDQITFADMNGDGIKDIITTYGVATGIGEGCIIHGRPTYNATYTVPTDCDTVFTGAHPDNNLGQHDLAVLDLDANGSPDVLISARNADVEGMNGNGAVYAVFNPVSESTSDTTSSTTGGVSPASKVKSVLFGVDGLTLLGAAGVTAAKAVVDATLPPQVQQDIYAGTRRGSEQGALRGLTNVLSLLLSQNQLASTDAAQLISKALFYVAVFSLTFAEQMATHGDALQAFGSAVNTIGTLLATEFFMTSGARMMGNMANDLERSGWKSTANGVRTASENMTRYGLHAHNALAQGPVQAASSFAAATVSQYAVEEGAKAVGLTH